MSALSEAMYGELEHVENMLFVETLTLEETQGALLNAIKHIRRIEARLAKHDGGAQ